MCRLEPGCALMPAGREERIEGLALDIRRHSAPIVANDKLDMRITGRTQLDIDDARPPRRERVHHGIESEVGQDLPERSGVALHRKIRLALNLDADIAIPRLALQARQNLLRQLARIECPPVELPPIGGHLLEGLHQFGGTAKVRHQLARRRADEIEEIPQARSPEMAACRLRREHFRSLLERRGDRRRLLPTGPLISWATPATNRPRAASFSASTRIPDLAQISQRSLRSVSGLADFMFGALAFGNLFGGDVDCNDLAARRTQRVPIRHPRTFLHLVGALPGHLDADHGFSRLHDRADDLLDRARERRHAIPDGAPEMIFDRYAADFGEALIDLKVAAVRRQAGKADRRGIIDQLQRWLLRKQQHSGG